MKKKTEAIPTDEYQNEVLNLFRKILDGVELEDIDFGDRLQGQQRLEFLTYCSQVVTSPWFELIFASLFYPHIIHAATQAENYDVVTFNRATANGTKLVKEFFIKYHNKYLEEFQKPDPGHNPHSAFTPVKN